MENSNLADRYFYLKAEIERLQSELDLVRQQIIDSGQAAITGRDARVTVSATEFNRLSTNKMKDFLTVQQVAACTTTTAGHLVRVKPLRVTR